MIRQFINRLIAIMILISIFVLLPVGNGGREYTVEAVVKETSPGFVDNFLKNPFGTLMFGVCMIFRVIGDVVQLIMDSIQNSALGMGNWIVYEYDDLNAENNYYAVILTAAGYGSEVEKVITANKYTNVGEYVSGGDDASDVKKGQKGVDITETCFSAETGIPVITVDYYNLAINDISFLDINYLTGDEDHEDGSAWMKIRNVFVGFIRATLYVSAVLLITMLIFSGVKIVTGSFDPRSRKEDKEVMNKFVTAIVLLIGTVFIPSLCIFGTERICEFIAVDTVNGQNVGESTEYELPIRVHVESSGYSFSTNFTGYVRYLTQIDDVDQWAKKFLYTFIYLVYVVLNIFGMAIMLIRVFGLYLIAIYAPITVVMYMFSKDEEGIPARYRSWMKWYAILCSLQFAFAITYRVVLEIAIR